MGSANLAAKQEGIQVRRVRKALRITGHDRKAKRLAWPVTSGKRGMGKIFAGSAKISKTGILAEFI